jgi:hypothetical protein
MCKKVCKLLEHSVPARTTTIVNITFLYQRPRDT